MLGKANSLPFVFSEVPIFSPFHGEQIVTPDRKLKMLYRAAYDYLKYKIGKEALEQKLDYYRRYKVDNMNDAFWHLLNSLTNKVARKHISYSP
jgi:hypothetical protein